MKMRIRERWHLLPFIAKAALLVLVLGVLVTATARAVPRGPQRVDSEPPGPRHLVVHGVARSIPAATPVEVALRAPTTIERIKPEVERKVPVPDTQGDEVRAARPVSEHHQNLRGSIEHAVATPRPAPASTPSSTPGGGPRLALVLNTSQRTPTHR